VANISIKIVQILLKLLELYKIIKMYNTVSTLSPEFHTLRNRAKATPTLAYSEFPKSRYHIY